MKEGEVLIHKKTYNDGSILVEHRNKNDFLLAKYIGYYRHGGVYQMYPAKGERHYSVTMAGQCVSPRLIR